MQHREKTVLKGPVLPCAPGGLESGGDLLATACFGKMSCGPSEAQIFLSYSAARAEKGMRVLSQWADGHYVRWLVQSKGVTLWGASSRKFNRLMALLL